MNIVIINFKNKSYPCFFNKHLNIQVNHFHNRYLLLNIQVNHFSKNIFLYNKTNVINNINLFIDFNMQIKISIDLTTIRQHSKKLVQLDKLYKNEDKFSGIGDNFIFKLSIFYNKYQFIGLFSEVYLESIKVILIDQV